MLFQRRNNTSSLLLALLFITFFHSAFSRHRIRHFRDRFKRQQGANLYLPESYVTDGGDSPDSPDAGPWTDWSAPTPCSRTCGGGVSTQTRQCQIENGCRGPTNKHFSCNTQDCPDLADYRAQQCSEYDRVPFEGVYYQWLPYTKGENECELKCTPRGERFYLRHQMAVVDGTRCNDDSLDVCVNGKCQPVGCDMMLGSTVREDRCRQCGGDGSSCNTIEGVFDNQDLQVGYNDILLVPAGSTNVIVHEQSPSNNYLAVRNTTGHYYLNGNWRIDFPRTLEFSGCRFHYERELEGLSKIDKLRCLGPIDEPLFIVLLYQDVNPGVKYEYSVPTNVHLSSGTETYVWTYDTYSECSASCGGGIQQRNVSCVGRKTLQPADPSLCDPNTKPESESRCGEQPCEAQWVPHPWGNCSVPCGEKGGVQTREVSCQQVLSNGYPSLVSQDLCQHLPKPPQQQSCNEGRICAKWHIGPWKPCDHLCGEGKQVRKVKCFVKDEDNKIKVLDDRECDGSGPKPDSEKTCNIRPCEGVDWVTSEWSGCDRICGLKNETRKVYCATASGQIFPDDLCDKEEKPELVRPCESTNASCEYLWYASQWSECSVECGNGVQTRTVFCGVVTKNGVQEVEKDKCDPSKNFELIKDCVGEQETCFGEWFSGPWADCSKPCGGGERTRKVICLQNNLVVDPSNCDADKIIFAQEECNTEPCTADSILPTDITHHVDESEATTVVPVSSSEVTVSVVTELETGVTETAVTGETTEVAPTESPVEKEEETDEDIEYEIVPDDECEDGEWVDEEEFVDVTQPQGDEELGTSTATSIDKSSEFSLDDLMLSDGTSPVEDEEGTTLPTGSGDGETTVSEAVSGLSSLSSDITEVEGSGDTSATETSISSAATEDLSNIFDVPISPSDDTTGATAVSGETTISSGSTTEAVTDVSAISGSTEAVSGGSEATTLGVSESSESSTEISTSSGTSELATESSETPTPTPTDSTSDSTTSSDQSSTTEDISSESTTEFSTTEAVSETTVEGTSDLTTESSASDQTTLESTGSTTAGLTEETSSAETTEEFTGTTESVVTESTTAFTGSTETTLEFTGSTEATSEAGSTESTILFTGSTESTVEFTGSTESTTIGSTESGATELTTEFDIWSSTTESGATEGTTSSELWETTSITDIFETMKPRMCKRRKLKSCKKTKYGCCWDQITAAKGPFDKGCPTPKTCKETLFGCCEDGVSQALGPKFKGCPPTHCNETLFGCCPDKKTPAEGNNKEGCPPPPPKCLKSRYGCCKDNVTAAKGPKQKGCEKTTTTEKPPPGGCSNSTYGCCPDGIKVAKGENFKGCDIIKDKCTESYFGCCPDGKTSATGPAYQGCETPCSNSSYGCCPDGITPAHGYQREGCCLNETYGCCPDNITPARGPQFYGCGCQYSPYGCCPDNKTAARYYNNDGCGCQYTEHGCCPDNFTPAHGPDYQGCLCHTYQFGCCPDGVTTAQGPHQQGCGCRNSEFGCCSDEKTPATGPNMAGCGCDASKYGCCLDGRSEAQGDNFEGCDHIPPNYQASCSMQKERGSCRNYTVKWFFDMDYGGCSRFWYGGCDGNDNRFKSKEECDSVCVNPDKYDRCNLPKVPGPCKGYYPQWYYDREEKRCTQFIYGGCLGNNNRFETLEECAQLCVRDSSVDTCEQSQQPGPCGGQYRRYYYDKSSGQCREFIYGGCKGNNNNFPTMEACKQQCAAPGHKKDYCSLPRAQGNCTAREPRWYYDIPEKRCIPFYYSGCNGNNNNFNSKEACEVDCPPEIVKDTCHLPAEIGACGNYVQRWYYDTKEKACRQFYYGGCEGNDNNFMSEQDCLQRCKQELTSPQPEPQQRPQPSQQRPDQPQPFDQAHCFLPSDTGRCRNGTLRYFYDRADGVCKGFTYGGCEGNNNNFNSIEECLQNCGNSQDLCSLPVVVGPCDGEYPSYFYDQVSDTCKEFRYGGCGGNYNRFESRESCEQRCRRSKESPTTPVYRPSDDVAICYEPADYGTCSESYSAYFFNASAGSCGVFTYSGCGGNGNRFNSEEQCERQCGSFRGQDVCNLSRDTGPCRGYFVKYYYDKEAAVCSQFAYGGCGGNGNRFSSYEECQSLCLTHQENKPNVSSTDICKLPVDVGSCEGGYHKRWYFDNLRGECIAFIYTGCGGNFNNFKSFQQCINSCKQYLTPTEAPIPLPDNGMPPHECQVVFDECTRMSCEYGIDAYVDENQCNRCMCHDPCKDVICPEGTRCAVDLNYNNNGSSSKSEYITNCRSENKPGSCPHLEQSQYNCDRECESDAECRFDLKCCSNGCGTSCVTPVVPAELFTQPYYQPAYTIGPIEAGYQPPTVDVKTYEPEVKGLLGDYVILNCAITGNPNPRISWSKDGLQIDGTQPRYRLKLDQTLQILTLHKTDSGIYLCTASNEAGPPITNQIQLNVIDSEPRPATVLEPMDDSQPETVVSLNAPATINCFALGYPYPAVTWWKDDSLIPLKNNEFEVRKDYSLVVHSVQLHNLGIYTCQAYNGVGKAASWSVTVKAKGPYYSNDPNDQRYMQYIVNPPEEPLRPEYPYRPHQIQSTPPPQPPVYPNYNQEPNEIVPELPRPGVGQYNDPVQVNISVSNNNFPVGGSISLPCDVRGYPPPQVQWYKDGVPLETSQRIHISDYRLTIDEATEADSGDYSCEAANDYHRASSSVRIVVESTYIDPSCTDSRHLANCNLIVKANYCSHRYYAKFCCRSCTEAGLLPSRGNSKQEALQNNLV